MFDVVFSTSTLVDLISCLRHGFEMDFVRIAFAGFVAGRRRRFRRPIILVSLWPVMLVYMCVSLTTLVIGCTLLAYRFCRICVNV